MYGDWTEVSGFEDFVKCIYRYLASDPILPLVLILGDVTLVRTIWGPANGPRLGQGRRGSGRHDDEHKWPS